MPLCGRYSKPGNGQFQPFGEPIYDGRQPVWIEERISLQDFIGQQIQLRFDMASDDFTHMDGIYIDDLEVHVISPTGVAGDLKNTDISLGQAFPNPASASVSVLYRVPFRALQPAIVITDVLGREVARQTLTETSGTARINLQNLGAGVYTYFLEAGGERLAAKRLVVLK
ncbi:MAG: T9SS type A sorting domain-containing protein [Sphingobacteriales bacterium]|nr:MAG: T9SS type A sorting domain-containing protein [Sphingobacteriales bacterium]